MAEITYEKRKVIRKKKESLESPSSQCVPVPEDSFFLDDVPIEELNTAMEYF